MTHIYFITHPEVRIDPDVPVPEWDLSHLGRRRADSLLQQPWIHTLGVVYSSHERKSVSTAEILAPRLGIPHKQMAGLGEVDRTSTGYLEPDEHDRAVAQLFAQPDVSIRGWEMASAAQHRIVGAVQSVDLQADKDRPVAIVSHGGVGTLLMCQIKQVQISRDEAGPGQGNYFCFRRGNWNLVHGWRAVDDINRYEE